MSYARNDATFKREMRKDAAGLNYPTHDNSDMERIELCREDLPLFLKSYFPHSYTRPFSDDQLIAIGKIQQSILHGGTFSLAMPRGTGKTTIVTGAIIWALCYAHRRFIPVIGSDGPHGKQILNDIKIEYETNDHLAQDFPEICGPVKALEGRAQRSASQHIDNERTHIQWRADEIALPTVKGFPQGGSVVVALGITGAIRGLKRKTASGEDLRPDFVVLDDPQTFESAQTPEQVKKREKIIKGDILGLSGHDKQIAAVMPCTVIKRDDLADKFLSHTEHPEWQGHRTKMVYEWPAEHTDMWLGTYQKMWKEEMCDSGTCVNATEYYEANREKMDAGSKVADPHLYAVDEISALQHAYHALFRLGDYAFAAECQNDPEQAETALFEISPELVASRVNGMARLHLPVESNFLTGFIDINYRDSGLHYAVTGVANDLTGWIANYGRYPDKGALWSNKGDASGSADQAIYDALFKLVPLLFNSTYMRGGKQVRPDIILVDAGYKTAIVYRCVNELRSQGYNVVASMGVSATKFRAPAASRLIGKMGDNLFLGKTMEGRVLMRHNADYWRVNVQRAFLLEAGSPGSISLYKGSSHEYIADHICAERLLEFRRGDISDYYNWFMQPGAKNDLLDCVVGAMVAAGGLGAEAMSGKSSGVHRAPAAGRPVHTARQTKQRRSYTIDV